MVGRIPLHNIALAHRLEGKLNVPSLEWSLAQVIRRHDALRTSFAEADGEPHQIVQVELPFNLPVVDVSPSAATTSLEREAQTYLDPGKMPLFRIKLWRARSELHYLTIVMHHLICDRWSLDILSTEVSRLYAARVLEQPEQPTPSDSPPQYQAFADWQRDWLSTGQRETQLAFWGRTLPANLSTLQLPTQQPLRSGDSHLGERLTFQIDAAVAERWQEFCKTEGVTLFAGIYTAFTTLLSAVTGQKEIVVCAPVSGRHRAEARGVIGYCNNLLPIRVFLQDGLSWSQLLRHVHDRCMAAFRHQDVPFQEIQGLPLLASKRLARCLFTVQNSHDLALQLPNIDCSYEDLPTAAAEFDLALFQELCPKGLRCMLDFKPALISRAWAEQFVRAYQETLINAPAAPPREVASSWNRSQRAESNAAIGATCARVQTAANSSEGSSQGTSVEFPDDLESQLLQLWEDEFGAGTVEATSNFFYDLGGHSFMAARLFERIACALGHRLPPSTLLIAPTIKQLAALLRQPNPEAAVGSLVPIQQGGTKPKLICVHGGGGDVLAYRMLAQKLGPDQPLWGLRAKPIMEDDGTTRSIEAIAREYVRELRILQPQGPYYLGGHSFGALVAYEMAHQLQFNGAEVALLAMFDCTGPAAKRTALDSWRLHWMALSQLNWSEKTAYVRNGLVWRLKSSRLLPRGLRARVDRVTRGNLTSAQARQRVDQLAATITAMKTYQVPKYEGRVTLFRAMQGSPSIRSDPWGGWKEVTNGKIEVRDLPCTHMNMFSEPLVSHLAEELRACMYVARAPDGANLA